MQQDKHVILDAPDAARHQPLCSLENPIDDLSAHPGTI